MRPRLGLLQYRVIEYLARYTLAIGYKARCAIRYVEKAACPQESLDTKFGSE